MDPNATLAELRAAAREYWRALQASDELAAREHAHDLAESFSYLDEWLTRGGFLPDAWTEERQKRVRKLTDSW